jgi:hypothetical protein
VCVCYAAVRQARSVGIFVSWLIPDAELWKLPSTLTVGNKRFWASVEIRGLVFRYPPVISRLGLLLKR